MATHIPALDSGAALGDVVVIDRLDAPVEKPDHAVIQSDDEFDRVHSRDGLLLIVHMLLVGFRCIGSGACPEFIA